MSDGRHDGVRRHVSMLCGAPGSASLMVLTLLLLVSASVSAHDPSTDTSTAPIIVNVGVRGDAKPFSYVDNTRDSESILPGFSGYSIEVCRHVLKQMQSLPRYRHFVFKATEIRARDRFKELGAGGKLFMLCGPDSITTERLLDYRSTHAVFLSGMTYAYINPRSLRFPRDAYCENVIGVVRGTTADTEGLADIASRDLLMRFDEALDLEVNKTSGRIAKARQALYDLTVRETNAAQVLLDEYIRRDAQQGLSIDEMKWKNNRETEIPVIRKMLEQTDLGNLDKALDALVMRKNGLAGKIAELMGRQHAVINAEVAREIVTDECPQGFSALPVRKFEGHDRGIAAFCSGEVLYYLADYDILKSKTQEIADCDIVMNRFTRSREVYGVYFSKMDTFHTDPGSPADEAINVAGFYADFNNVLLMAMQGEVSEVEKIFEREFGVQQKSEDLEHFFNGFKINLQ